MVEHDALDAPIECRTEEIPATDRPLVASAWQALDRQARSAKGSPPNVKLVLRRWR